VSKCVVQNEIELII